MSQATIGELEGPPLAGRALVALAALAALPRLLGLSAVSMWLDEILQTWQMRGGVGELLAAQRGDDHPPLDALISMVLVHAGAGEALRRLLPVLWGVLAVVVLARWTSERFGPSTGAIAGLLAAFAPIHVHYSQELRPYSLALLLVVVALWRADACLRTPGPRQTLSLAVALVGCAYTLYLSATVLVPIAVLLLAAHRGRPAELASGAERCWRRAPGFLAVLAVVIAPVAVRALSMPGRTMQAQAVSWSLGSIAVRWQDLTVSGVEGAALGWGAAVAALVALCGALVAGRSPAGRAVLAGLVTGTVGVELLLVLGGHWSNARYDLVAWPFLVVLLALGLCGLAGAGPGLRGRRVVALAGLAALVTAELRGVSEGLLGSRPHWGRVAAAVMGAARPGEALLAANEWTRVSLLHYLEESGRADLGRRLVSIEGDPARLDAAQLAAPCVLLVSGGYPASESLAARVGSSSAWLVVPRTVSLFWLSGTVADLPAGAPTACERDVPLVARRESPLRERLLPRFLAAAEEDLRLDFDDATTPHLVRGFSGSERSSEGVSFRWATGREAELALALTRPRDFVVSLALWPFDGVGREARMSVRVNGWLAGEWALVGGRQVLEIPVPAAAWRVGENRIALGFARAVAPRELDAASGDARALAAAFDEIRLIEP